MVLADYVYRDRTTGQHLLRELRLEAREAGVPA
jgi:hypothetical protein